MNNLLSNYVGFEGRLNRQPFWISAILLGVVSAIISLFILPLIGLSLIPNIPLGGDVTAADVTAIAVEASRKAGWIGLGMFIIFLYPSAALCIKRRHDRNNSGLDVWIYFALTAVYLLIEALGMGLTTTTIGDATMPAPSLLMSVIGAVVGIYAIYLFVVLGFLKGTAGPNTYGPDPLQG